MTKTRIRFLREQSGKTQGELADLLNTSPSRRFYTTASFDEVTSPTEKYTSA